MKAVLRGKFIARNTFLKKFQINNQSLQPKDGEQEQTKPKTEGNNKD